MKDHQPQQSRSKFNSKNEDPKDNGRKATVTKVKMSIAFELPSSAMSMSCRRASASSSASLYKLQICFLCTKRGYLNIALSLISSNLSNASMRTLLGVSQTVAAEDFFQSAKSMFPLRYYRGDNLCLFFPEVYISDQLLVMLLLFW